MRKNPLRSALIAAAIFLFVTLPEWFGSIWPLFSNKTLPEWIAERHWTLMSTSATSWLVSTSAVIIVGFLAVISYQTRGRGQSADFYPDRRALRLQRHGIQEELENLGDSFWVMWQVGHQMTQIEPNARKKITRMILGNPADSLARLERWAKASNAGTAENLRSRIIDATRLAKEVGTLVKWNDEQSISMIIANPQSGSAGWVRIEYILPFLESTSRPSVVFEQRVFPELFAKFVKTYEVIWDNSTEPTA